jgi:hypothetical protein
LAVGGPVLVTLCSVFPSLCVPSVSAGNLATSPVPGTVSHTPPLPAIMPGWPPPFPSAVQGSFRCALGRRLLEPKCKPGDPANGRIWWAQLASHKDCKCSGCQQVYNDLVLGAAELNFRFTYLTDLAVLQCNRPKPQSGRAVGFVLLICSRDFLTCRSARHIGSQTQ